MATCRARWGWAEGRSNACMRHINSSSNHFEGYLMPYFPVLHFPYWIWHTQRHEHGMAYIWITLKIECNLYKRTHSAHFYT